MKKLFTSILLIIFLSNLNFGQGPILSQKFQSLLFSPGLSKNNSAPLVPASRTCGTMEADSILRAQNPSLGSLEGFEIWLQKKIALEAESGMKMPPVYTIPVIVHIIHNGEAVGSGSNISQAQVNSQIDVLNEDFGKTNADASSIPSVFQSVSADMEIQFCAAVVDPSGNTIAQPGIDRISRSSKGFSTPPYSTTYIDGTIKPNTYWDPTKYFNIWVLNLSNSLLGYAQFPNNSGLSGLNANEGGASTDGIVILYTAFGRVGNVASPYNKGRTATHETGHWLGLRHIWGDGSCATDYCGDTPTADQSHGGCPSHPYHTNVCGGGSSPNGEMFMNYMDYTNDACMYMFTANQRTRMRTVMQNSPRRVELITSTVCSNNSPPICGFTASSFTVTEGASINYTDQSGGTPTTWSWTFQGGSPASSTSQNPSSIVYNTAGTYNTTLIATNAFGTCTLTQVITVVANVGCDTLNYPPPGTLVTYTGGGGYVCGWNTTYKDISKADYFASYSPYTHITGGLINFRSAYRSSGSNGTVSFRVWDNTGTGGSPGTILGSKTITLQTLDAAIPAGGALYQVIFDSPIQVTTPFYFGITMSNFANADSLGIVSNTNGDSNPNTAWEQWSDNIWYPFNDGNSWQISISQFISPFMTNLPPNAALTASDTNECVGSTINFNGLSSTNETSYSWTFTGGSPSASTTSAQAVIYNTAGIYKTILTVGGSCQGTDKDSIINIIINGNPTVSATATNVSCNGGNNGTATATSSGGTSPYTYSWSNGQSAATATGLTAGTYTVTITDNNGCNSNASVAVTQPSALTVSSSSTNSNCGSANGYATAVPSGGNSPYNFLWNNGQTTATASGLAAGTYSVTVTDNSGCSQTATTTVSSTGGGLTAATSTTNVSCNGGNDGNATATPGGGTSPYNYQWNTGAATQSITALPAGTYSVTITDVNTCSVVQSVTVSQPSALLLSTSQTNGTCGNANGSATIYASGGTSAYSYLWNNGQTSSTATGLTSGTYIVTVSDANNCSDTSNVSISNATAPSLSISATNVLCNGNNNGSATVNPTGGSSPFTYNWSTGGTGTTISNLSPGNYSVTVTDNNNCTSSSSVSITQPGVLNSSATSTGTSCNGICDGAVSALASGGTSPYNYNWSGGLGSGSTKPNVCAGNYSVTITDANNCSSTSSATVNQPAAIVLSSSSTKATCGSPNGTATINATGGAGGFSYLWNNGQTTSTATGLNAGTFSVTVTDANSCSNSTNVSVSNDIPTTLSISSNNVSCNGGNNGSANAVPSGGTLPYTYAWSNGGTNSNVSSLIAGTYTVTVSDANNCTAIQSVVISEPDPIAPNPTLSNITCTGSNDGSVSLNMSGGTSPYTYNWSNGGIQSSIINLSMGSYSVTISDANNCTNSDSFSISEPAALSSMASATATTCNGICNGTLSASSSGGTSPYSYNWSGSLGTGASKSNVCAGNYSVTITDANNCSSVSSATVTQPSSINLSMNSSNATCGISNGSASVNASGGSGGFSYLWNNGSTNPGINGLSAGTYTVTVTDAGNCTNSASINVSNPGAPTLSTSSTNSTCNGTCNGSASVIVNGGNSPYTYQWNNGQTGVTVTSVCAGTYFITVTDASNCVANSSVTVGEPISLSVTITINNAPCSISATANSSGGTSGYSYLWSNGQNTQTSTGLNSGTYSVTVTDASNCTQTTSANVTNNPANITATASANNVLCNGGNNGSATAAASGGNTPYSYIWSNGQGNSSATGLSAGTYNFTATDANGCSGNGSVNISEPSALTSTSSSTNVSPCNGDNNGTAGATASGGVSPYTFLWNTGEGAQNIDSLPAGAYSFTVTDANACMYSAMLTITEPPLLDLDSSSTPETCGMNNGTGTVIVSGGTSPYIYQWNANAGSQTTQTATGLNGGSQYSVLILDASGCFSSILVPVQGASSIIVNLSATDANCGANDGTATVNASGGTPPYSYLWSNDSATIQISNLQAQVYYITVTDNAGCTFISSDTVNAKPGIISSAASTPSLCGGNNGLATVNASGGVSPYYYLWSNGDSLSTADSLYAGNYTVIVNDVYGCADTVSVVVGGTGLMTVNPVISNENCGKSDGVAIASVSGGKSPYSYLWSDSSAQTTQVVIGLKEGNYTVTITDADNCTTVDTITIINTSNLVINSLQSAGGHCGSSNGTVASSASGGPLPYSYQWSNGDTTSTANGMVAGTHSVTITDSAGCKVEGSVFVGSSPIAISDSVKGETCDGKKDGSIDISVSGGVAPYSYKWSNEASSEDLNNISQGQYIIIVTDANGCPLKDTITVGLLEENGCLDIPTGFTPNGDGKNDTWKIRGIGNYPDLNVEIFNRWGSLVFSSKGYQLPWDGTNNGNELPAAAYYYIISLGDGTNKTGSVTIVR